MLTMTRRFALVTASLFLAFGAGGRAVAGELSTPAGLTPGESFRFVFVTDGTTTATSTNIADYNSFVKTQAGGATYNGSLITWYAIASTLSTTAVANIGENTSQIPIYMADGTKVTSADNSTGLWSGQNLNAGISEDLRGVNFWGTNKPVWTGSDQYGTLSLASIYYLGTTDNAPGVNHPDVGYGLSGLITTKWVDAGVLSEYTIVGGGPVDAVLPLYGISQVLTVSPAVVVPEPTTIWMAAGGVCAGVACSWWRRRLQHRRSRPVVKHAATK